MASIQQPGFVAVNDAETGTAGAIVWWRLCGRTEHDKLSAAWALAGHSVDLLPQKATPAAAIKDAVKSASSDRLLARPLGSHAGYAMVHEIPDGDDLEYTTALTVKILVGEPVFEPQGTQLADQIDAAFRKEIRQMRQWVVGGWLAKLATTCNAVSLRPTGGIYFIPQADVARFRAWAETFMDIGDSIVYEVPALESKNAVAAILDAVEREARDELTSIDDEITEDELGKRALRSRERRCVALRTKLEAYSDLLGPALDGITAKLESTKASVVEAMLLAEATD